jgi:hypothetical protein
MNGAAIISFASAPLDHRLGIGDAQAMLVAANL